MNHRTIYSLVAESAETFGAAPALHQPLSGGNYRTYTWIDVRQAVEEIAAGLRQIGIGKGDIVALNSETRAEFYLADLGVMTNGSIAAALYTSYQLSRRVETIRSCDARAVIVDTPKSLRELREAAEPPLPVQWILLTGEADEALTLDELRAKGARAITEDAELQARFRAEVEPEDPAILYLTSGATGEPKMGLVSHRAVVSNADMGPEVLGAIGIEAALAFLPSAHITQRVAMEFIPLKLGIPVWFSAGLNSLPREIQSIKPVFFVAPPRVWERIYSSICTEIGKRGGITKKMFYGALGIGLEASRRRLAGKPIPPWLRQALKLADKLVFTKIRERFGGRLRLPVSGGAPLGKKLAEFYAAIGMPLVEGYGLTEAGVVVLNPLDAPRPGSIGKPLPGVELKVAEDGELLIKSPTLFSGYYNDPEATAKVLKDGWLATGDVAEITDDGFVYITGRKKEVLVASNGRKIFPAHIESLFNVEPLINQVLLLGDGMPYVAALLTLNPAAAASVKGMEDAASLPMAELVRAEPIQREVKSVVARVNQNLAPFERIRKYQVLERDFTIADGELTPTMKVRRRQVLENHKAAISLLYRSREPEIS